MKDIYDIGVSRYSKWSADKKENIVGIVSSMKSKVNVNLSIA